MDDNVIKIFFQFSGDKTIILLCNILSPSHIKIATFVYKIQFCKMFLEIKKFQSIDNKIIQIYIAI